MVSARCVRIGVNLMLRLLATASRDPDLIPAIPQDLSQREYFGRTVPGDGWLCWDHQAARVLNFIRACDFFPLSSPWGHPRTCWQGRELSVVKAARTGERTDAAAGTVGRLDGTKVLVACADEWIRVDKVLIDGHAVHASELLQPDGRLFDGNH
jgi:methionyl-tRNA formyltransferase